MQLANSSFDFIVKPLATGNVKPFMARENIEIPWQMLVTIQNISHQSRQPSILPLFCVIHASNQLGFG